MTSRLPSQPVTVWMDQSPPQFGAVAGDRAGLAACLGLGERDLLPDEDARVVSTGAAHLLVPAVDRAAVDRAAPGRFPGRAFASAAPAWS
jgi:trans-2,3-dihydro-3-hydroxyanthranilate isomerase